MSNLFKKISTRETIESICQYKNWQVSDKLKQKRKMSRFLKALLYTYTKKTCALSFIFSTDEYVLTINKKFLNHNTFTDIITFDLSNEMLNPNTIIGEIYISIDRIKENAKENQVSQADELHRVMIHGVLHLCGFGDKTKAEKEQMRALENYCLQSYAKFQ
ncbi:MAG: rRNA maturation RNase YbeY [Chitinophagaceae bacterium]